MKFLLVFAVVLVAFYWWRSNRRTDSPANARDSSRPHVHPLQPQDMIQCPVCAVHLPRGEALAGQRGLYCSDDHRLRAEG